MQQLNWDDLKIFPAIAQGESVRSAAQLLGKHHSTVARRLEHLNGRSLGRFSVAAYASRSYLKAHDPIRDPEQCS